MVDGVAERMMVTRAMVTGVLDLIEARGLLRRLPHARDGRSRTVSLTRAGRRVVDRLVPRMHAFERELTGCSGRRVTELAPTARLGIR